MRPAGPDDDAVPGLLHEVAPRLFRQWAGSAERALRMLRAVYGRPGHAASWDCCLVAELDGEVVGVLAGYPEREAARRQWGFLLRSLRGLPPWRWAGVVVLLGLLARVEPPAPAASWYVDALAVAPAARRRGAGRALLAAAEAQARAAGCGAVSLDTEVENAPARALYEAAGFRPGPERRARPGAARRLGTRGYVAYVKELS